MHEQSTYTDVDPIRRGQRPRALIRASAAAALFMGVVGCDPSAPPTTYPQSISETVAEDAPLTFEVEAVLSGAPPSSYGVSTPNHGSVTGTGPSFVYTPPQDYAGTAQFDVTITGPNGSYTIPVEIVVTPVNDVPVATAQTATTDAGVAVMTVLAATDPDDSTLTFAVVEGPQHGTLSGTAPYLTYTPDAAYEGPDSFTFTASDAVSTSSAATVTVQISHLIVCGDGLTEGSEACDDGNADETDGCLSTCATASCGDGAVQAGVEACDDGNAIDTDGCLSTCATASCGDGAVQAGVEACDDGNAIDTDGCLSSCAAASCGDGIVHVGVEACDDGNADETDACRSGCIAAVCGDGIVHAGVEACDDGNADETDGCLSNCAAATCGDGAVQAGIEACDDANQDNGDGCLNTCVAANCGDGFVQVGIEACDDGNRDDTDACLNSCALASCGDGFAQSGVEACDDGNQDNTDTCLDTCAAAFCGDGFVQAGVEQCDDANAVDGDACLSNCVAAFCGDGIVQAGVEQCDDANTVETDACLGSCAAATCGDAVVQAGVESCDDGNPFDSDGCSSACVAEICGDGIVHAALGEQCDDANTAAGDGCGPMCRLEVCGDGVVQFFLGEQCDDGNAVPGDGCTATCTLEAFSTVAAVRINAALSCTTATANAARKVAVDPSGNVFAVMTCGADAYYVISRTRGASYTAPQAVPGLPLGSVVSMVSVGAGSAGVAYVVAMLNTGDVYLSTTTDYGVSWSSATLIGSSTSTTSGLSLQTFNDDVYIGYATSGGVTVASNHARGQGAFTYTSVGMSIAFFDVLYDARLNNVAVAADTPGFHVRISTDRGVSFAGETNPPGQQYYSDWALGNGSLFVVGTNLGGNGDSDRIYVIPAAAPTTSTPIFGLPTVTTAQMRTVAASTSGDAYVASRLDDGALQLDRLAFGGSAFDTPRALVASGASPSVAALPSSAGAAVAYTVGSDVWVTVQAY